MQVLGEGGPEFLYVLRRRHSEELMELFPEIFLVVEAGFQGSFIDILFRADQQLGHPSQPDKPDEAIDGLTADGFDLFIQARMAHAYFKRQGLDRKFIIVQVIFDDQDTPVDENLVFFGYP